MFAWYNIGFQDTQLGQDRWHQCLEADLKELFMTHYADVVLLSECGEVGDGLGSEWNRMMDAFCEQMRPNYNIRFWSEGHYTTLVDTEAIVVLDNPHLVSLRVRDAPYRQAQHLVVEPRDGKPVVLYNVHCPASRRHPFQPQARREVVQWILNCANKGLNIQKPDLRRRCCRTRCETHYTYTEPSGPSN